MLTQCISIWQHLAFRTALLGLKYLVLLLNQIIQMVDHKSGELEVGSSSPPPPHFVWLVTIKVSDCPVESNRFPKYLLWHNKRVKEEKISIKIVLDELSHRKIMKAFSLAEYKNVNFQISFLYHWPAGWRKSISDGWGTNCWHKALSRGETPSTCK